VYVPYLARFDPTYLRHHYYLYYVLLIQDIVPYTYSPDLSHFDLLQITNDLGTFGADLSDET